MGYSKESVLPEQKVYCHTYDSLVGVLADRMVIREKVLLPQEGDGFDHEDIYSWIRAVDLEDKGPKIEASLSAERGKNPVTIDVEKQETIKSDDEKVSNETLLYSMALTEAKMKVISDIAEETYPAVAFQIKDYRREMEKIREEILGSVEKGSSLDEILSRMSTRRGFLLSSIIIAGMVLAACNHLSTPEPTTAATPFQPQVTETSPAYETPGVTETPFVEVTPTVEETEVSEPKLIEWESVELEIGGRPMKFVMGREEGFDPFAKWGFEGFEINKDLTNYQEKFATLISASFWQIYQSQSMKEVSYEEYMQNPENYKINLITPDGEGGFRGKAFTLDQISGFEIRYIDRKDPRLYYENLLLANYNFGYKIREDGTFVMYKTYPESSSNLEYIFSQDYLLGIGESLPLAVGHFENGDFFNGILGVAYAVNLGSPEAMPDYRKDFLDRSAKIKELCDYPTASIIESSQGSNYIEKTKGYLPSHSFWRMILD